MNNNFFGRKELFSSLLFFVALLFIHGCADENPDLVNPSGSNDSIKVRFINYSGNTPLTLAVEGMTAASGIAYGASSSLFPSPYDSVNITISDGSSIRYQSESRLRFSKASIQTLIALPHPSIPGRDTIISFSSELRPFITTQNATMRVLSVVPGADERYSLRVGCPSGAPYVESFGYSGTMTAPELPAGKTVVALVRSTKTKVEPLALYELALQSQKYYTVIIFRNPSDQSVRAALLDEKNGGISAISVLPALEARAAFVRAVNFSADNADISRAPGDPIVTGLSSGRIGDYTQLTTCIDTSADRILLQGQEKGSATFEVNQRYTVIVADSASGRSLRVIPPVKYFSQPADKASIRAVHLSPELGSLTISVGAEPVRTSPGFRSGQVIAAELRADSNYLSNPLLLESGEIPITILSSRSPVRIIFATTVQLQAGHSYLLAATKNASGGIRLALLDEDAQNESVQWLDQKNFTQIVNAIPDQSLTGFSLDGNFLPNVGLYYRNSLATVLAEGNHTLSIGNTTRTISLGRDSSYLLVLAGTADNPEVLVFSKGLYGLPAGSLERRFINAARPIPLLLVSQNLQIIERVPQPTDIIKENLAYGSATSFEQRYQEQRTSLFFWEQNSRSVLDTSQKNILLQLGKQYSVIFTGTQAKGYSAIIQQEF